MKIPKTHAALWLATLIPLGCSGGGEAGAPAEQPAGPLPAVEAVQARSGALPLVERLSGVVKAQNQVSIRPEVEARIAEVLVRSGEAVRAGQPLVRLEDDTLREQLRQAEANVRLEEAAARVSLARVAELKAQVVRARDLSDQQLVSRLELETLEAQLQGAEAGAEQAMARVEQARATRDERRSAIDKTVVRAPIAGHVGRRNAEVGMLVDNSTLLIEIGNLDQLMVEVPVTGEMLGYLREGQEARISARILAGETVAAELSRISPFLSAGSFSTVAEIDVANPGGRLRPGMFVEVDLLYGESEQATLIPTSALWQDPASGTEGVYVASLPADAREPSDDAPTALPETSRDVVFRPVEVVAAGRQTAGVRGVEAGEWVVIVGQHLLRDAGTGAARVRAARWESVLSLQALQREDLLHGFLEKQQRLARQIGAQPPTTAQLVARGAGGGAP